MSNIIDNFQHAKKTVSNAMGTAKQYLKNEVSNYVADAEKARQSGLYQPPVRPNNAFMEWKEKTIKNIPVVGGPLNALLTPPKDVTQATDNFYNNKATPEDIKVLKREEMNKLMAVAGMTAPVNFKGKGGYIPVEDVQDLFGARSVLKGYNADQFINDKYGAIKDINNLFEAYGPKMTKAQSSAMSVYEKAELLAKEFIQDVKDKIYR